MEHREKRREDQQQEIRTPHTRLAKAQETQRAIRSGEVGSLGESTPENPRPVSLQGADHTYRNILGQMQEGAVTMVEDGQINDCNQRFAAMVRRPLEHIIGSHFCAYLIESDRDAALELLHRTREGSARGELTLQAADGEQLPVHVALDVVAHDERSCISMVVTDLRERKPISQADLANVMARALGIAQSPPNDGSLPTGSTPSRTLRILVAEDTPANQKLVTYLLTGRGHAVTIVENGQQAVDLLVEQDFDVVLMDIQMPVMDGLKATATIRAMEPPAKAHIRIIAMTAHALQEDAERCIAAGMDGYISKPLDADTLIDLLERTGERDKLPVPSRTVPSGMSNRTDPVAEEVVTTPRADRSDPADPTIFAPHEAVRRCFGSEDMLQQMITYFLDEVDVAEADIRTALKNGDGESLHKAAHRLKTTIIYLAAQRARTAVQQVESLGRTGDLAQAPSAVEQLSAELGQLRKTLLAYRENNGRSLRRL